jgi:hypothetical protein
MAPIALISCGVYQLPVYLCRLVNIAPVGMHGSPCGTQYHCKHCQRSTRVTIHVSLCVSAARALCMLEFKLRSLGPAYLPSYTTEPNRMPLNHSRGVDSIQKVACTLMPPPHVQTPAAGAHSTDTQPSQVNTSHKGHSSCSQTCCCATPMIPSTTINAATIHR